MPIASIWFPEGQGQTGRSVLAPEAVKACAALPAYRRAEAPTNRSINRPATLAIMFSSLLAITIVQILMVFLVRARRYCLGTENPIAHFFRWLYRPMIIDKACER
jgi:hypothetical protein